jgi:hypothetical protein
MNDLRSRIGHDVGDYCDRLWANALRAPRHSSKTEPQSSFRLGASRECRLSQGENK